MKLFTIAVILTALFVNALPVCAQTTAQTTITIAVPTADVDRAWAVLKSQKVTIQVDDTIVQKTRWATFSDFVREMLQEQLAAAIDKNPSDAVTAAQVELKAAQAKLEAARKPNLTIEVK